jgi:hypothetical protein
MPNLLDYLFPQTMGHVRGVERQEFAQKTAQEALERQKGLETLAAFSKQPDLFAGVPEARVPSPEVLAAYTKSTGLNWPMAPMEQTGAPPQGLQEPVPGLASNMPQETLAVMRSPISQVTNEMNQKAVAETLSKIKAREAGLEAEGTLPQRELQQKSETLQNVFGPAGFTPTDIGASIIGKYPLASQKELLTARGDASMSPTELALKAAGGDASRAMGMLSQMHRDSLKPPAAQAPPVVKMAQQFMQKFGPYISSQLPPMMQVLFASGTLSAEVVQAIQSAPIDPAIKQQFMYYSKILDQWTQSQMRQMGIDPSAFAQPSAPAPAPASSNDPLGIR